MKRATWIAGLAVGLLVLAGGAWAQGLSGPAKAPRSPRAAHAPRAALEKGMDQQDPGMAAHGRGMGPGGQGTCCCQGMQGAGMGRGGMRHRGMGPGAMGREGMGRGGMGGGWMGRGFGHRAGMMAQLDLSEAQRARLADIHERTMKQNLQARADLGSARIDLARLMRAERPDREAIAAQIDRIADLRASVAKARVNALLDAHGVLTPEQLKKAKELHRGGPMGPHADLDMDGPGGFGDLDDLDGPDEAGEAGML